MAKTPKHKWDEVVYINKRTSQEWFNDIGRIDSSAQDSEGNWHYTLTDVKYNEEIEELFAEHELEEYVGQNAFNNSQEWNGTQWVEA